MNKIEKIAEEMIEYCDRDKVVISCCDCPFNVICQELKNYPNPTITAKQIAKELMEQS